MENLRELHRRLIGPAPLRLGDRLLLWALVPIGLLYGLVGAVRRSLYRFGWLPRYRASVPVVAVGNLTAGGTGKTPMVDYVIRHLQSAGRRVAVVSRGYGGAVKGVETVSRGEGPLVEPAVCGDEPYLLAWRNPTASVVVAPRRADGVRRAERRLGADVIVLDDGFQHLPLARDLDIVLLDAGRPLGNGHLLPAGLLREFPGALRDADLVIFTRSETMSIPADVPLAATPALCCRHRLGDRVRSLTGQEVPLASLRGRKGVAFAGIADPDTFFAALKEQGLVLAAEIGLPDHADFDPAMVARLNRTCFDADFFVTTEKDGVKLKNGDFSLPCYTVPVDLDFEDAGPLHRALENLFSE